MTDDDGILDDTSAALEALAVERATPKDRSGRHAPPGFNPAAVFLLSLSWINLFEQIGGSDSLTFRCKGCGEDVRLLEREKHFKKHRRDSERPVARPQTTNPKEANMAKKDNGNDAAPKVSKTKLARETAISVLKSANKPMLMPDIVEKVLANAKVKDADIPAATVRAQINFELAEEKPVIVRVDRGVYAHKDAADKTPPEKPGGGTSGGGGSRKASRKSGTGKRSTAKQAAATSPKPESTVKMGDLATKKAKADPKPAAGKANGKGKGKGKRSSQRSAPVAAAA